MSSVDDCAVIDEIQMIAESERGFAWTKALLGTLKMYCVLSNSDSVPPIVILTLIFSDKTGLLSPEIHLCGEPTAIDLIKRLVDSCGDDFEVP